ncbi:MAG: EAL domain-containing protein [Desulfocapsaceae bacterium]|nr:EAL domain-containing protein [Desulfocapsaceae bacterium]
MKNTSKEIFREQTYLLYLNSKLPITISVAAAGLFSWSLRSVVDHRFLIYWFTAFFIISAIRLYLLFLYSSDIGAHKKQDHWHNRFLILTCISAATWGSASFFLFPEQSLPHQIVFFMIMLGMAAGAVSSLCPSLPVVLGYLSLLLIPVIAKMITIGSEETWFNASLVLMFWAVTVIGSIKINENIRENIELHLRSVSREKILKVSEERYRHIFSHAPLGIFHYDADGIIIDCNDEFVRLLKSSKKSLIGLNMPARLKDQKMLDAIHRSLAGGEGYYEGDYTSITSNSVTPVRTFFKAIKQTAETVLGGVGIVEDFTERKKSAELIQYQASYDHLTGLANRRMLLDSLDNEISRARRHNHYGALLYIDLDNFKTINDSLGHSAGDQLLKIVAKRIRENLRREDTAARMGGDEFIIIATELDTTIGLAAYKAKGIAEKVKRFLSAPASIDGNDLQITSSIGVSIFPAQGKEVDDILKQADSAMYRSKTAGRNSISFFLPHMQEAANERLRLNMEIRRALEKEEFVLYYQPQVDLSGRILSAEALIRWNHPERGLLLPGAFLEVAEETGLMHEIGQWVFRSACRQIKTWADTKKLSTSQTISINISGKEIAAPGFIDMATGTLEKTGADPHRLGIELTEGSLVPAGEDIVEKIMTLRKMGVKFSVDDFGTGYSSLSYLKRLPLNTLKIDRSFIHDIKDGSRDVVLVDTIISMAKNLGLDVIAEGVETEEELRYLSTRGCHVFQGYYFSKPVPTTAFTKMLEEQHGNL